MRRSLLLIFLLVGCKSTPAVLPQTQPNLPVAAPSVQPMTLHPVEWRALSPDDLRRWLVKLPKNSTVILVLDEANYNNLSLNLIEIERYIKEQKTIIDLLNGIIAERANLKQDK